MPLKQETRTLQFFSPLGPDVLLVTALNGSEELSRLFVFGLEMISDNPSLVAGDLVGKNVTVVLQRTEDPPRCFNGFVKRFTALEEDDKGRRNYRAEIVPWLWFLTRTTDCRIFQNKTVVEIIEQIFTDLGFRDFDRGQVKGHHPKREYCVQYREDDFSFVSRLMEEEGIFYFFKHENGKHTLIMADHKGAYLDCPEKEVDCPRDVGTVFQKDHIQRWEHRYEFHTGKWAQTDYNFETPSQSLMTNETTITKLAGADRYEKYDYPGEYGKTSDGRPLTKLRIEEDEAEHDRVHGAGSCKTFSPGFKFKLASHVSSNEKGKTYVLTSTEHNAVEPLAFETGGGGASFDYRNFFTCIPDSVSFRPARTTRRPTVAGLQTAVVVGPPGEEIYPDKYGRVKVQFHWDREGKKDDKSSCWIRVSQVHAGKGFGSIHIPRIGEEVIVAFLEGDPDQPIIVGRFYHAENMPPFGLPDSKTICGMKSKTYKGGGYNEIVMDDTTGKELIRVHAQYDMSTTVEHDQTLTVNNDRTNTVHGKLTETVDKDTKITITQGTYTHDVAANKASYHVNGPLTETYDSTQTTTAKSTIKITSLTAEIYLLAATKIILGVGGSQLSMDSGGNISLSGSNVKISGKSLVHADGGKVLATGGTEAKLGVGSQNIACDPAKVAVSGAAINSAAVGMHEITGAVVKIN